MTPRLYVIVRGDLPPGARVAQAVHGFRQFVADHPEIEKEWFENSNTIVILQARDEAHICTLADRAEMYGVPKAIFREPDLHDQATCLVLAPTPPTRKICRDLPLAA